ncbi:REP element-mobilizing transposase RayT [Anaerovirgula multivorans]|uniref:REP element-mobilizing transposase RayT n=1 Tax=Anaerovirgula multivorans TaxID=312168 RepID=A0A239HPF9_9FIRM|nr:transposase [Anaerovirgula multivorans]SNS82978.1 REP element-mobilizing transposase RayT [Anaerovirgula multivorans]
MPRVARIKAENQIYHIIQRGNERKNIFLSDDDKVRFLDTLERMKEKYNFKLEAYCLMDNHVHLLVEDNGNDISRIMKSINVSYAYYFNHAYKRVGHLFQDRFKSEIIQEDSYLLSVSAYIHNNPVKAKMVELPEEYKWSSFNDYLLRENSQKELVDTERILGMFSSSRKTAVEKYYNYVLKYEAKEAVLDVEEDKVILRRESIDYIESLEVAEKFLQNKLNNLKKGKDDLAKDKELRREMIIKLRRNSCLTLKEIGELVGGISQSMVCKILKGN